MTRGPQSLSEHLSVTDLLQAELSAQLARQLHSTQHSLKLSCCAARRRHSQLVVGCVACTAIAVCGTLLISPALGNVIDALTSAETTSRVVTAPAVAAAAAERLGRFGTALLLLLVVYVVSNGASFCQTAACQVRGLLSESLPLFLVKPGSRASRL